MSFLLNFTDHLSAAHYARVHAPLGWTLRVRSVHQVFRAKCSLSAYFTRSAQQPQRAALLLVSREPPDTADIHLRLCAAPPGITTSSVLGMSPCVHGW